MTTSPTIDTKIDVTKSLLWQHDNAEKLKNLVFEKQIFNNINHDDFWKEWTTNIFNLNNAGYFGVIVWSIILDLPIDIKKPEDFSFVFGFGENNENFENGNFLSDQGQFEVTLQEAIICLQLKYFKLITRDDALSVNSFLALIFADLFNVYMLDNLNMSITYVFSESPEPGFFNMLKAYDLLPRGATRGIDYIDTSYDTFGFSENNANFNNGGFRGEI